MSRPSLADFRTPSLVEACGDGRGTAGPSRNLNGTTVIIFGKHSDSKAFDVRTPGAFLDIAETDQMARQAFQLDADKAGNSLFPETPGSPAKAIPPGGWAGGTSFRLLFTTQSFERLIIAVDGLSKQRKAR